MTPEERKALEDYVVSVRAHYGEQLVDLLVYGSRARGDNDEDSDVDVAVILEDGTWEFWTEKRVLSDIALEAIMAAELLIHAWPISRSSWTNPATDRERYLIESMQEDAKPIASAA
jgi:uncharacterized protein